MTTLSVRPARARVALSLALSVSVAVAISACSGSALQGGGGSTDGPARLEVGLLVPKSGVYAVIGTDVERGFRLYLDENDGQARGVPVDVTVADTAGDPATGRAAAQRLIQSEGVDVLVGLVSSAVGEAVKPIAVNNETPLIVTVASNVPVGDDPYVWRTNLPATGESVGIPPVAGEFLGRELGDGVFTVASDYAGGQVQIGGFVRGYEAAGAEPGGQLFTPFQTTTDYQPYLSRIADADPEAVYAFYAGTEAVNFVKQYAEFGLADDVPLYGFGTLASSEVVEAQGDAAVGLRIFLEYAPTLDNPTNERFVAAYRAAHSDDPSYYSATSYTAGLLLDAALRDTAGGDGDLQQTLLAGLKTVDELDAPEGRVQYPDGDQSPRKHVYLLEIESDGGELVYRVVEDLGTAS